MEAMATSATRTSSSSALLLEHAFGKRLVNGTDEWQCVDSVVRSSFLLLYHEFRRQAKKLSILEANQRATRDEWATLMHEQHHLHSEELQLVKAELSDLRLRTACCKSPCDQKPTTTSLQVGIAAPLAAFAERQQRRHQKLRRRVTKFQSQLRTARRAQHECEEIVVCTAEKQQRQIQSLAKKLNAEMTRRVRLENTIHKVVLPRLEAMETHAVLTPMPMQIQLQHTAKHRHERQNTVAGSKTKYRALGDQGEEGEATLQDGDENVSALLFKSDQHDRLIPAVLDSPSSHRSCRTDRSVVDEPAQHKHQTHDNNVLHSHSISSLSPPPTPVLLSTGHASLRLRYQRERRRQIRRLDRLRVMKAHGVVTDTTPKRTERSVVR